MKLLQAFRKRPPRELLDAALRVRIEASFDAAAADEEHFPSTIDPRIEHVQVLLRTFNSLAGKRILDAGCGKGRFARVLAEAYPEAEIWGIDISARMLAFVPPEIRTKQALLTELPFPDVYFDGAYAIESLEHAVEIDTAVSELCRVVAPGNKILIIDKNVEQFGRLATPDWERWFGRRELEKLLLRDCRSVSSNYLSYWDDIKPDGLFFAWVAER